MDAQVFGGAGAVPATTATKPSLTSKQTASLPFRPVSNPSYLLGLTPLPKVGAVRKQKLTALDKHRKLLRQLRTYHLIQQHNKQLAESVEAAKQRQVTAFAEVLRSSILNGQGTTQFWSSNTRRQPAAAADEAAHVGASNLTQVECTQATATSKEDMEAFVDAALAEAANGAQPDPVTPADNTRAVSTSGRGGYSDKPHCSNSGRATARLPTWALTQAKAEEMEEESLLEFANDLDFDAYAARLDDAEYRTMMKELKDTNQQGRDTAWRRRFVTAINHLANKQAAHASQCHRPSSVAQASAHGSEGGESTITKATEASRLKAEAACQQRTALNELRSNRSDKDWDATTKASSDVGSMTKVAAARAAEEILRENPELRFVHSTASAAVLLNQAMHSEAQLV